ncbi:CoA-binding protein, partial [Salmonella enterica]|uniref:CoA-binding protein n=1 Tax=Salmonella enterica TaxID=28901 RepID=UPI003C6E82F3
MSDLPIVPDIAILCTHASRNVSLFKQLAEKGVRQVIVLSSDMYSLDAQGEEIQAQCMTIAKSVNMRILGPNSLGLILP